MTKHSIKCDFCGPQRPGYLWLGRDDWLKCPQCAATGELEVVQQLIQPRGKVFLPGDTKGFTLHHPEHDKRFG